MLSFNMFRYGSHLCPRASRDFLSYGLHSMYICVQFFPDSNNGIGAGCAMAAGSRKAARVDKQGLAQAVAYCFMGMTIDNTVERPKRIIKPLFNIVIIAGAMGQANLKTVHLNNFFVRQLYLGLVTAHVAVYGMDLLIAKSFKYRNIG